MAVSTEPRDFDSISQRRGLQKKKEKKKKKKKRNPIDAFQSMAHHFTAGLPHQTDQSS